MTTGTVIRVREHRAVFVLHTASVTRYVVDMRAGHARARYFRARSTVSFADRFDDAWQPLAGLCCLHQGFDGFSPWGRARPGTAIETWILAEGAAHLFATPDMHPDRGPLRGVASTRATRIESLETIPDWVEP